MHHFTFPSLHNPKTPRACEIKADFPTNDWEVQEGVVDSPVRVQCLSLAPPSLLL